MISGSVSLLCSRFFSPFPHGTGSLSVSREYLALRDGPRGFMQNFSCSALLRCRLGYPSVFSYRPFTFYGGAFQHLLLTSGSAVVDGPTTPHDALLHLWFGLLRVRSPLLAQSLLFSFPPGTEMFQFPGLASSSGGCREMNPGGLPHSEIRASQDICS